MNFYPIHEVRQRNLMALLDAYARRYEGDDLQASFERRAGLTKNFLSQAKRGHKTIGNRIARRIERAFGLLENALDDDGSEVSKLDASPENPAQEGENRTDAKTTPMESKAKSRSTKNLKNLKIPAHAHARLKLHAAVLGAPLGALAAQYLDKAMQAAEAREPRLARFNTSTRRQTNGVRMLRVLKK